MQVKLKNYLKAGIPIKKKNQVLRFFKNNRISFFSPDFIYLNSRFSTKIREFFKIFILNRRKLKLLFSFPRTSLLKKYSHKKRSSSKNSSRYLKELEFCSLLEMRIDILLFRLGFVATLSEARHLISHKKIKINNFSNSSFSYLLKKGDVVSFVPSLHSRIKNRLTEEIGCRTFYFNTFDNVEINLKNLKIIVLTEKVNIKQQMQHYPLSINWNSVLKN